MEPFYYFQLLQLFRRILFCCKAPEMFCFDCMKNYLTSHQHGCEYVITEFTFLAEHMEGDRCETNSLSVHNEKPGSVCLKTQADVHSNYLTHFRDHIGVHHVFIVFCVKLGVQCD